MVFKIFGKIAKKLQMPGAFDEAVKEVYGTEVSIKLSQSSPAVLRPGDIVTFTYQGGVLARRLLVVATERAPRAKYVSTRGNYLLCCFELKETYPELVTVFNSFYKQRSINYASMPKTSRSALGITNYKTFKINDIRGAYKIELSGDIDKNTTAD
jgi:hypothetical protein